MRRLQHIAVLLMPFAYAALILCMMPTRAAGTAYHVDPLNPTARYKSIGSIPWTSLMPGDSVSVHYQGQPYHEKAVFTRSGTSTNPITIQGIPGPNGEPVVIDGLNATTAPQFAFKKAYNVGTLPGLAVWMVYNEASLQPVTDLVFKDLEITGAFRGSDSSPNSFTDSLGIVRAYPWVTSGLHLMYTKRITLQRVMIHGCGNGLFVADSSPNNDTLADHCRFFNNSNPPIAGVHYTHQIYSTSSLLTLIGCQIGPPRPGSPGAGLKSRGADYVDGCTFICTQLAYDGCEAQNNVNNIIGDPRHLSTTIRNCTFYLRGSYGPTSANGWVGESGNTIVFFGHEYLLQQFSLVADAAAGSSTLQIDANPQVGTGVYIDGALRKVSAISGSYPGPWKITLDQPLATDHLTGEVVRTNLQETRVHLDFYQNTVYCEYNSKVSNFINLFKTGSSSPSANDPMTNAQSVSAWNNIFVSAPATTGMAPSIYAWSYTQGTLDLGANDAWPKLPALRSRPGAISVITGLDQVLTVNPLLSNPPVDMSLSPASPVPAMGPH